MFHHHLHSTFLAGLALALSATTLTLSAGAARAGSACGGAIQGVLAGNETVPGPFFTTQNIFVRKESGAGISGPWLATEWIYTQSIAPGTPAQLRAVMVEAIASVADVAIPGIEATCHSDAPGGDTVRIACTGHYPFEVQADGTVTSRDGLRMGHVTPASGTTQAQMAFSMIPMNPMYQGKVSGPIDAAFAPGWDVDITAAYDRGVGGSAVPSATYTLRFSITPYNGEASKNLHVEGVYNGKRSAHTHFESHRDGPEAVLTIRLDGPAHSRKALGAATDVVITTEAQGCPYRYEQPLEMLMLMKSIAY